MGVGLILNSCHEILGVTTLLSRWDQPTVETSVPLKKRLPGHTLSALYSPEVLSAPRAVMLSETSDCFCPEHFFGAGCYFVLAKEKVALNQHAHQNFGTQRYL